MPAGRICTVLISSDPLTHYWGSGVFFLLIPWEDGSPTWCQYYPGPTELLIIAVSVTFQCQMPYLIFPMIDFENSPPGHCDASWDSSDLQLISTKMVTGWPSWRSSLPCRPMITSRRMSPPWQGIGLMIHFFPSVIKSCPHWWKTFSESPR